MASSSRYASSYVNGEYNATPISKLKPIIGTSYTTYIAKEGDSFESVAVDALGDPKRYWEVAIINPHVQYPNYIPPGTKIRIPL